MNFQFFFVFPTCFFVRGTHKKRRFFMVRLVSLSQISMLVNHTSSLFLTLHISATSKPEAVLSLLDSKRNQCFSPSLYVSLYVCTYVSCYFFPVRFFKDKPFDVIRILNPLVRNYFQLFPLSTKFIGKVYGFS